MTQMPTAAEIERLQRRRTRLTITQAILFVFWQSNFFIIPHDFGADRPVDRFKLVAYFIWAALLLVFIATGGNWWQPSAVRAILNDETTTLHRHRAMGNSRQQVSPRYFHHGTPLSSLLSSQIDWQRFASEPKQLKPARSAQCLRAGGQARVYHLCPVAVFRARRFLQKRGFAPSARA